MGTYIVHNKCCRLVTHLLCLHKWANIRRGYEPPYLDEELRRLHRELYSERRFVFTCPKCRQKMNLKQFNEVVEELRKDGFDPSATIAGSINDARSEMSAPPSEIWTLEREPDLANIPVIDGVDPTLDDPDSISSCPVNNENGLEEINNEDELDEVNNEDGFEEVLSNALLRASLEEEMPLSVEN